MTPKTIATITCLALTACAPSEDSKPPQASPPSVAILPDGRFSVAQDNRIRQEDIDAAIAEHCGGAPASVDIDLIHAVNGAVIAMHNGTC